jgi:hypothetical protein
VSQEKPSAQVLTADGAGGMRAVVGNRFEGGAWPIDFVVKAKDATPWMPGDSACLPAALRLPKK